jgi:hypothetical protein
MGLDAARQANLRGRGEGLRLLALVLAGVALWVLLWLFAHTDRSLAMRGRQIGLFFGAFVGFLAAVQLVLWLGPRAPRRTLWFILAAGIIFRLSVAPVRPVTTSDIYRYLWEGRVVRAGLNPFREAPDSPPLVGLRDWVWPLVQYKSVPAAYPPVAQYLFALSNALPTSRVITLKLLLAVFDIGTVLLLPGLLGSLGRPRAWAIIYAWHPLVVGEVVARGHLDSLGIFFLVLAWRLLALPSRAGRALAGVALAASILAKGYAILALPFMLLAARPHRRWFAAGLLACAAAAYLPFASAGLRLLRGLALYTEQWQGNASVFALLSLALSPLTRDHAAAARVICGAAFSGWLVYLFIRARAAGQPALASCPIASCFLALAGWFVLSPVVYPWYLAWTVPFLCLTARPAWLVLTGTIFGFYAHDFAGPHVEIWWVSVLEYGLPLLVAGLVASREPAEGLPYRIRAVADPNARRGAEDES